MVCSKNTSANEIGLPQIDVPTWLTQIQTSYQTDFIEPSFAKNKSLVANNKCRWFGI
ncbi:hypothetical protein BH11BAC3_BH11BAC3_46280 [soil metagenome]